MVCSTAGRIAIDDGGRIAAAPWPVVPGIGPELTEFDFFPSRIEHRTALSPAKSFGDAFRISNRRAWSGANSAAARPTQSASVERLCLAVKR